VRHGPPRAPLAKFCELLALLDEQTPLGLPIHLILDPVSSHWSTEVTQWLATHRQRTFRFHFLPVHASWLSFIGGLVFDPQPQVPAPSSVRR